MVDSVNGVGASSINRIVTSAQSNSLRNTSSSGSVTQSQNKSNGASSSSFALAVPQTSKSGSRVKVPRGSLVDIVA